MHAIRLSVTALSSLLASRATLLAVEVLAWRFDDVIVQRVVLGTFVCVMGGMVAYLTPLPGQAKPDMSFRRFLQLVALGAFFGVPTTLLLYDSRFDVLSAARPIILLVVGILAYPMALLIQRAGPVRFLRLMFGRLGSAPPPEPPPPPGRSDF